VQGGAVAAGAIGKYLQGGGLYDPFNTLSTLMSNQAITSLIGDKLKNSTKPVTGAALIQALDKSGLVNILSTPNILTSDNKEAEINVGENVPFQGSATQSSIGTTTSVERKDIGINLKIKPQISEGDYIRLDINQEISAVKNDKGQAVDLVTTKRSAKTSIVVKDKETIVIGGLIQDSEDVNVQKVPFLGDIPGLGWLFKTTTKSRKKTNLMILLTPHIIKDAADLSMVSDEQRDKFGESAKKLDPVDVQKEISGK
jgi:general secretion pathway protein D